MAWKRLTTWPGFGPIYAMDQDKPRPPPKSPPRSGAEIRREREAEALRANLRKRKEQQRAREAPTRAEPREPLEDTPGGGG
jgi:hypothetical protein